MASSFSFQQLRFSRSHTQSGIGISFCCANTSIPYRLSLPSTVASVHPLKSSMEEGKEARDSITSIINPSFQNANLMFFRSAYNVQVLVDENEPEEVLVRRFRREVMKAGVIPECKRRRFFENRQEEKKRKIREAGRRRRRRRFGPRPPPAGGAATGAGGATPKEAAKEEEEDNWDMPEGGLPY